MTAGMNTVIPRKIGGRNIFSLRRGGGRMFLWGGGGGGVRAADTNNA